MKPISFGPAMPRSNSGTERHPCFTKAAHHRYGRLHLPVAPACNVKCRYCVRKFDCVNESRPGVSSVILDAAQAMERVRAMVSRDEGRLSVIGVAGPGDPLANNETFVLLHMIRREYPDIIPCVSTNGLALPDRLGELLDAGLRHLTVTINSVKAETAAAIYSWVNYSGEVLRGVEAGRLMVENQWKGLRAATQAGMTVKVNSVLVPGVNDLELARVAARASALGAATMNIIPMIPQGDFAHIAPPDEELVADVRKSCGEFMPMMTHCRRCRADAVGLLGEDRDMETETLMSRIGQEYEEMVAM